MAWAPLHLAQADAATVHIPCHKPQEPSPDLAGSPLRRASPAEMPCVTALAGALPPEIPGRQELSIRSLAASAMSPHRRSANSLRLPNTLAMACWVRSMRSVALFCRPSFAPSRLNLLELRTQVRQAAGQSANKLRFAVW